MAACGRRVTLKSKAEGEIMARGTRVSRRPVLGLAGLLSVAALVAALPAALAQDQTAQAELSQPTRHFRVEQPANLTGQDAMTIYARILDDLTNQIVEAGMRRTIFAQRDEVLDEEIFPMERMKLEMLRDQNRNSLEPPH